jgi:uncharacterized protein (DUF433 family)
MLTDRLFKLAYDEHDKVDKLYLADRHLVLIANVCQGQPVINDRPSHELEKIVEDFLDGTSIYHLALEDYKCSVLTIEAALRFALSSALLTGVVNTTLPWHVVKKL